MKSFIVTPLLFAVLSFSAKDTIASDNLWIGEYRQYDTSNSSLPDNSIYSIISTASGNVWAGSSRGGLASFDGTSWKIFTASNSPLLPGNGIREMAEDHKNNLWIGTDSGLVKYNGINWTVFTPKNSPMKVYHVWAVAIDLNNNIWFGNGNVDEGGLMFFNGNDKWKLFTPENSLLPNRVASTIVVDHYNTIWLGTTQYQGGGGLVRIQGDAWTYYNKSNSLLQYNSVQELCLDSSGNIWIGQNGAFYLTDTLDGGVLTVNTDGNNWQINNPSQSGKSSNCITALACDKRGYVWIATSVDNQFDYSFSVYNKKRWLTFSVVENDTSRRYYMPDIAVDKDNNIWFATDHGVLMLKQDTTAIDAMFANSAAVRELRYSQHKKIITTTKSFDLLGKKHPAICTNAPQPSGVTLKKSSNSTKKTTNVK